MRNRVPQRLALLILLAPGTALAQWQAHVDLGLALPVGGWQSELYGPGVAASATATGQLSRVVDFAASLSGATLTTRAPATPRQGIPALSAGGFGWLGVGLRLRPYARAEDGSSRLWIQAEVGGAVTGGAAAPGTSLAGGWSFAVGAVELGPYVSWWWLPQTDGDAYPGDAHVVALGVRMSLPRIVPPPPPPAPPSPSPPPSPPPPPPRPVCPHPEGIAMLDDVTGDGCPDPDTDRDAIADPRDRCPTVPEDRDGFEDDDGCPDPDNDRDGIPDARDLCPNEPEVVNAVDDDDGCPDQGLVELREGRIVLEERVFFDTNSYRIRARSASALDAVATLLRRLPPRQPVVIEGHADERGDARYNRLLSLLRATAVQRELTTRGLWAPRFRVLGFGRAVPLRSGRAPEDLAANRRVEVVVSGVGSTGVAQTVGGWVRIDPDGSRHRAPEPVP